MTPPILKNGLATASAEPDQSLVDHLAGARVLCVGDVMLDRYIYGRVDRVSPEAPIPVIEMAESTAMLGGAGNVAANLVALGADCRFVAVMGDDEEGRQMAALAADHIGVQSRLVVESGRMTTLKTRYIAGGHHLLRADRETRTPLESPTRRALLAEIADRLPLVDAIVLSDYGKGVLGDGVAAEIIDLAKQAGRVAIVDPKGRDFARYRGADVLTPNRRELAEATGRPTETDADVEAAARQVIADAGVGAVVATRSEQGMSVIADDRPAIHHRAVAREIYDVSGAGDTVIATLAAALAAGNPLGQAAALANLAGGIVVGKVGTAPIRRDELAAAVRHARWVDSESKVTDTAMAQRLVTTWRADRHRIGFTNGCFDLLHPGHLSLLRQARARCDRLVVGLNDDASVRRLKGANRPIQNEVARAAVLASLEIVDLVVVFAEDTPLALIDRLRPHVLVKGADYAIDQVVGADLVQSYGGEVFLAALEPGHSTTATIARLSS